MVTDWGFNFACCARPTSKLAGPSRNSHHLQAFTDRSKSDATHRDSEASHRMAAAVLMSMGQTHNWARLQVALVHPSSTRSVQTLVMGLFQCVLCLSWLCGPGVGLGPVDA